MAEFMGFGPGTQPGEEDGTVLEYMEMPKGMAIFRAPLLPEPEDAKGVTAAKTVLRAMIASLEQWTPGACAVHDITGFSREDADFIGQALGDGEVSILCGSNIQAQESVMAGVWRVRETGPDGALIADRVEIGAFPQSILALAFAGSTSAIGIPASYGPGVFNAPPLLAEINDAIARSGPDNPHAHAINLSLLPHTEDDLGLLDELLGKGPVTVLSRGYGNCRVMATALRHVWWVRFYNSQDTLILNSIEVAMLPDVVMASPEDLADSAERLREIMAIY